MFFEKPDVRYVDMCKYIDDHIYTEECNHEIVYQYLYHIVMMIASKSDYFDTIRELDDFSVYSASVYYMRLIDKRQIGQDATLEKVRSILNYVRKTLFSVRMRYCNKYSKPHEVSVEEFIGVDNNAFSMYVDRKIDPMGQIEICNYLDTVQVAIKEFLMAIPYKYGTTIWTNIYISCMLSLLNSITLRNKDLERINNFKRPNTLSDSLLNKLYTQEKYGTTILYHLDSSMYNYITALTNRIKHKMSIELSGTINAYTASNVNMKNLLLTNIQEQEYHYEY